jgi:hypothetical protein
LWFPHSLDHRKGLLPPFLDEFLKGGIVHAVRRVTDNPSRMK